MTGARRRNIWPPNSVGSGQGFAKGWLTWASIARRPVGKGARKYHTYFYEPLESQEAIERSVHWAMGLADRFVITPGDMGFIPKVLEAALRFEGRPSDARMKSLVAQYDIQPIFKS